MAKYTVSTNEHGAVITSTMGDGTLRVSWNDIPELVGQLQGARPGHAAEAHLAQHDVMARAAEKGQAQ